RDGGDALAAAGETQPVGGGGAQAHRSADRSTQGGLRLVAARTQTRAVADDLDRGVADDEAGLLDAAYGLGEQGGPAGAGPLGLGGAEVLAEVTEAGGRQQRVAQGVGGHVGIGVALEAVVLLGPVQS